MILPQKDELWGRPGQSLTYRKVVSFAAGAVCFLRPDGFLEWVTLDDWTEWTADKERIEGDAAIAH